MAVRAWLAMRDPDYREFDLDSPLLHITEIDLGYPEIREVSDPRPEADGTVDRTHHFAARIVTLTGKIAIDWQSRGRRQLLMDRLSPYLLPTARPWLYTRTDDGKIKRILLRPDQFSRPQITNVQDISISFKSPTGVLESREVNQVRVYPEMAVGGRTYDLEHDRVYPHGSSTTMTVLNAGSMPADWTARIFGPASAPAIVNASTGEEISLAGLTGTLAIPAGRYVAVDERERTVLADGDPGASRWQALDYAASTWWQLPPGETHLRLRVSGSIQPSTSMLFSWRDTYLL